MFYKNIFGINKKNNKLLICCYFVFSNSRENRDKTDKNLYESLAILETSSNPMLQLTISINPSQDVEPTK